MKRPNVVLIYTDQQRFDSIKANGNEFAITPNLDKLIEEGTNFENYYVNNPVCMPSRMCMLTGKYPSQVRISENGPCLPETELTIANYLAQGDYDTAQIGKLHFLTHVDRDHRILHPKYGFDTLIVSDEPGCYDDPYIKWVENQDKSQVSKVRCALSSLGKAYEKPVYSTQGRSPQQPYVFEGNDELTHSKFVKDEVCSYIRNHKDSKKPFFVVAGIYAPHAPINPPQKYLDMYKDIDVPLPSQDDEEMKQMMDMFGAGMFSKTKDITPEKWKEIIKSYLALTTHVDECVGEILDELKDIEDDTLVIFTSDHGEYLGDHHRVHKGMPGHDCIINVPLIMKYKGVIPAGKKVTQLCEAVDIVPTILDYCCICQPPYLKGISLKDTIVNNTHTKDSIIVEYTGYRVGTESIAETAIRTKDYKYYVNALGQELLYDLSKDPKELHSCVNDVAYQGILSKIRYELILKMHRTAYNSLPRIAPY